MNIFIIHNEEAEQLDYLLPRAEGLVKAVGSCTLALIGPEERSAEAESGPEQHEQPTAKGERRGSAILGKCNEARPCLINEQQI